VIVQPIASSAAQVAPRVKSSQAIGLTLAVLAGVHQAVIASTPTNDDFMHLVSANQILAGDWPYRDFFELYGPLMYGLSALSRLMFGHRLLSEAVVVGIALAVSTYLVFKLVRSLTGSSAAGVLSALLLMVAWRPWLLVPEGRPLRGGRDDVVGVREGADAAEGVGTWCMGRGGVLLARGPRRVRRGRCRPGDRYALTA
jgi:hypothetical protein